MPDDLEGCSKVFNLIFFISCLKMTDLNNPDPCREHELLMRSVNREEAIKEIEDLKKAFKKMKKSLYKGTLTEAKRKMKEMGEVIKKVKILTDEVMKEYE